MVYGRTDEKLVAAVEAIKAEVVSTGLTALAIVSAT